MEPIKIEINRKKDFEALTQAFADTESRLDTGSGAAAVAAIASAFFCRATALCKKEHEENDRLNYLVRNSEILRNYMTHLVDEDVKCRGPLRRATKEGDPRKIEAAAQTAAAVSNEIINMMGTQLELLEELTEFCPPNAAHFISGAADLSVGAIKTAVHFVVDLSQESSDETYRYVVRRENEISWERVSGIYERILKKLNT